MKKSKLLIPAVGFLMISLAAAGTSTVAWFSSTTAASASLGNIVGARVDGGLKIWQTNDSTADPVATPYAMAVAGTGETEDDADNTSVVAIDTNARLRDASMNMASKTAIGCFVPSNYGTDGLPTSFKSFDYSTTSYYTTVTEDAVEHKIYTFARFNLNFKAGNTVNKQAIYFDMKTSSLSGGNGVSINPAIRVGFVNTTSSPATGTTGPCYTAPVIWAPNETSVVASTADANDLTEEGVKYVAAEGLTTTTGTYAGYKTGHIVNSVVAAAHDDAYTVYDAGHDTDLTYLGSVSSTQTKLSVTFYVWFEGCDPTCIDAGLVNGGTATQKNYTSTFSGSLKFYALDK